MDLLRQLPYFSPERQAEILRNAAHPAPPGVEPNFDNPPNNDASVVAAVTVCVTLTTLFLLVRLYTKAVFMRRLKVEDAFGIIAFGTYSGAVWSILYPVSRGGFFVHQWNVTIGTLLDVLYPLSLLPIFYAFTLLFIKAAIILDWLSIFASHGIRNFFWWTCWVVLVLHSAYYIGAVFFFTLSCRPIQRLWRPMAEGSCVDDIVRVGLDFDLSLGVINLTFDLIIFLLPLRTIWGLKMKTKNRLGVSMVFSIGLVGIACAAGRLVSRQELPGATDITYLVAPGALWSLGETTCAFLILCMPTVPGFLVRTRLVTHLSSIVKSWSRSISGGASLGSDDDERDRFSSPSRLEAARRGWRRGRDQDQSGWSPSLAATVPDVSRPATAITSHLGVPDFAGFGGPGEVTRTVSITAESTRREVQPRIQAGVDERVWRQQHPWTNL